MTSPSARVATTSPARAPSTGARGRGVRRAIAALLIITAIVSFGYASLSAYLATRLVSESPQPITATPASLGLAYREVTFPAREDGVMLRGWLIPGVLPDGSLTVERTIIMVHGAQQNRTDTAAGALALSGQFARAGFAVLAFDARGCGESPPAPFSLSYFEQRDVLGAVDFLRAVPYPALGRPRIIGGWGVSMGANSLLLAAAREPAIAAIVADSSYPAIGPIVEREIPKQSGLPAFVTPGVLLAARVLYGVDFYAVRPGDVVASLAPRPLFFIQGGADTFNPPSNLSVMVNDAEAAPNANVQSWLVTGAAHAQSYHVAGQEYANRVISFFTTALGGT